MKKNLQIACIQPSCGQDIQSNLITVGDMIRKARDRGANFIATPENVALMEHRDEILRDKAERLDDNSVLRFFSSIARETKAYILVGSVPIIDDTGKVFNSSFIIDPSGSILSQYDKIHLFNVNLPNGNFYRESDTFCSGDQAVVAKCSWGEVGMTICYDLRFPSLYRTLALAGAKVITVPAAFTSFTGAAHWHVLLRARAIETGSFIIAPGMCGKHSGGRSTYGHSLIINPWGEVLKDAGNSEGVIIADIDLTLVDESRARIPSLKGDKLFNLTYCN